MSIFSDKLSYLMKQNDMSDETLADLIGVNRTTISRWRTGERSPKMEKLPEIATIFNVDPRIFVGEMPTNDISTIYNQLHKDRQETVYKVAEQQLKEQNNVVEFPSKESSTEDDLAAHLIDPNRVASPEEIAFLKSHLAKAKAEYLKKHDE